MLKKNSAAFLGFDDAGVHVTANVVLGALRVAVREIRFHICAQRGLRRTHRNHVVEPVAAVDVHVMSHGAESVRRVQVAIALHMRKAAPQPFAFIRRQNAAQVVEIGRFPMRDFSEESVPHHAQHHHLVSAITAVLQNDAMLASGLRGVDDVPAFLQCRTDRHLDCSMLAILHGAERHRNMPVPWSRYIHDVEFESGQILEIEFTLAESGGLGLACVRDRLLRSRHFLRHQITDRFDVYLFNRE